MCMGKAREGVEVLRSGEVKGEEQEKEGVVMGKGREGVVMGGREREGKGR